MRTDLVVGIALGFLLTEVLVRCLFPPGTGHLMFKPTPIQRVRYWWRWLRGVCPVCAGERYKGILMGEPYLGLCRACWKHSRFARAYSASPQVIAESLERSIQKRSQS